MEGLLEWSIVLIDMSMLDKSQFELLKNESDAILHKYLELELNLEKLVFGEDCFESRPSNVKELSDWTNMVQDRFQVAIENGIDKEWLSHCNLAMELRQAKKQQARGPL